MWFSKPSRLPVYIRVHVFSKPSRLPVYIYDCMHPCTAYTCTSTHVHVHNSILLLSPFLRLSLLSLFPFLSLMLVCYTHIFHVYTQEKTYTRHIPTVISDGWALTGTCMISTITSVTNRGLPISIV